MGKQQSRQNRVKEHSAGNNQIRIIGGACRGRRLSFPSLDGLRPTTDRVRETLFNWLQPMISGASCLDLFAGSGALGLEAASRGAAHVVMLDRVPEAAAQIQQNIELLALEGTEVHCADARSWLSGNAKSFDIVFLDPPFADDLLDACCQSLEKGGWLRANARIYLEFEVGKEPRNLPQNWSLLRKKKAGQVCYHLFSN